MTWSTSAMPLLALSPLLLLCLLSTAATGQKLRLGECPDIEPVLDFNATAFTGLWYENRKYANSYIRGRKCVTTRISTNDEGVIAFDTIGYEPFYRPVRYRGFAIQSFGPLVGSFSVGVPIAADASKPNLNVVEVNYENYAVLYSCENKGSGVMHREWLWVLTRTPHLSPREVTAILMRMSQRGIRSLGTRPTDQTFCPDNLVLP